MKSSKIFVIAPSGPVQESLLQQGISLLEKKNFHPSYQPNITDQLFLFAGPLRRRQLEFFAGLEDEATPIVWCARGGCGSNELLPELASWLAHKTPKAQCFIGFSDLTPILNTLALNTTVKVIHGPSIGAPDFHELPKLQWEWLETLLRKEEGTLKNMGYHFYRGSHIEGKVIGGNLSMLVSLLGTPYDFSYEDKILFLEDVNEPIHRIYRQIHQLVVAEKLKKIRGLLLGKFNFRMCIEEEVHMLPVVEYLFSSSRFPVVYNFPTGHVTDHVALPLNREISLDKERFSFRW